MALRECKRVLTPLVIGPSNIISVTPRSSIYLTFFALISMDESNLMSYLRFPRANRTFYTYAEFTGLTGSTFYKLVLCRGFAFCLFCRFLLSKVFLAIFYYCYYDCYSFYYYDCTSLSGLLLDLETDRYFLPRPLLALLLTALPLFLTIFIFSGLSDLDYTSLSYSTFS